MAEDATPKIPRASAVEQSPDSTERLPPLPDESGAVTERLNEALLDAAIARLPSSLAPISVDPTKPSRHRAPTVRIPRAKPRMPMLAFGALFGALAVSITMVAVDRARTPLPAIAHVRTPAGAKVLHHVLFADARARVTRGDSGR
jgi:hypothetical protein